MFFSSITNQLCSCLVATRRQRNQIEIQKFEDKTKSLTALLFEYLDAG
jgi:hypothetical protein